MISNSSNNDSSRDIAEVSEVAGQRRICNKVGPANMSEDDDDFVTPGECFGQSSKSAERGGNTKTRRKNAGTGYCIMGHDSTNSKRRRLEDVI